MSTTLQAPPKMDALYAANVERAVLGSILLSSGKHLPAVASSLTPDDFGLPAHIVIFKAIQKIAAATPDAVVDTVSLYQALESEGRLEAVGGVSYVAGLTDGFPNLPDVSHWVRQVKEAATRRALYVQGDLMQKRLQDGEGSEEVIAETHRRLADLAVKTGEGFVSFDDAFNREFPALDDIHQKWKTKNGLATGFSELDRLTGGLHPGELVILAARPSLGKTSLAMNVAVNLALADETVAVFSLEMSTPSLLERLICSEGHVNLHAMKAGFIGSGDARRLVEARTRLHGKRLYVCDQMQRAETMQARARALQQQVGLGLIVVDYLQLMSTGKHENRTQEISAISRAMKQMAKDLRVPVLALSQLSRSVEGRSDGRPRLSDLRESGQIEQDADAVIFLWREAVSESAAHPSRQKGAVALRQGGDEMVCVAVEKQRNGPTGDFRLKFLSKMFRFEDADDFDA